MNSYLTYGKKEDCFGCEVCVQACPTLALKMCADIEGYLYPKVDSQKCINCNICAKVCPAENRDGGECLRIIAAKSKSDEGRRKSTSGGVFPIIAEQILKEGGLVCGAIFDDDFQVVHVLSADQDDIEKMRGSKYVQSRTGDVLEQILQELGSKRIMFTGTPCQCDGLRRLVIQRRANFENLILCDLVCGKVPSPKVWKDYVGYLENHFSGKLTNFVFRSKTKGWQYPYCEVEVDGRNVSGRVDRECTWVQIYTSSSLCRPSCYQCPYTTLNRKTDITIGDFWGCEKSMPKFTDNKGISLVFTHTEKGNELLGKIADQIDSKESNEQDCLQDRLRKPTPPPQNRSKFWEIYFKEGIEGIVDLYGKRTTLMRIIYQFVLPFMRKIRLYDLLWNVYHSMIK